MRFHVSQRVEAADKDIISSIDFSAKLFYFNNCKSQSPSSSTYDEKHRIDSCEEVIVKLQE